MESTEQSLKIRLGALTAFLPQFEAPGFTFASFKGRPDIIDPHPWVLSPSAEQFVQAAYDNIWVYSFDWSTWARTPEAQELIHNPEALSEASVEQLEHLLTAYIRQDRFVDGVLAEAYESGILTRILRRAAAILEILDQDGDSAS